MTKKQVWIATFEDETQITSKIHTFKNVLDRLEELASLAVVQGKNVFTVNMKTTEFTVGVEGYRFSFFATSREEVMYGVENIRPIYFTREQVLFSAVKAISAPQVIFTGLGFQANVDGANIKRYLAINPDGTFTIEST